MRVFTAELFVVWEVGHLDACGCWEAGNQLARRATDQLISAPSSGMWKGRVGGVSWDK